MTSLLADLRAQPDFRTELWSQPEAEPKSEVTHLYPMTLQRLSFYHFSSEFCCCKRYLKEKLRHNLGDLVTSIFFAHITKSSIHSQ